MVVLLLALIVVAWLAKDALTSYGLMAPAATKARAPGEGTRGPAAAGASGATAESAAPAPTAPLDRARAVGDMLKQQEDRRSGGY